VAVSSERRAKRPAGFIIHLPWEAYATRSDDKSALGWGEGRYNFGYVTVE
jgi:hypothetical protein